MSTLNPLYSVAEIRAIEGAALAALPPGTLMQRAGEAAAELALELIAGAQDAARILVLAGPGNNGGDALVAACALAQAGAQVSVLMCADPAKQPADAAQALRRAQSTPVRFLALSPDMEIGPTEWSLVIDGLFGIGLTRAIDGTMRTLVERINRLSCMVLALDVPSGLDADTGNIVGENGIAVKATHTITFIGDKPGLRTCHGRDYAGRVYVASLQIDMRHFPAPSAGLNEIPLFSHCLRPRAHNSHKGSYGDVTVVGGARGMAGAALLAARTAAKCGAGRVYAAFADAAPDFDVMQPELMCRLAREHDFRSGTLVVGPGLGTSSTATDLLMRALKTQGPLVLDADALNLIAADAALQAVVAQHNRVSIMTPHPLEAARLLATTSSAVQADRLAAARKLAQQFQAYVILKGSGTVIARPDGYAVINPTGNPGLATGGTGDVLAGLCGALLAQGWPGWEAALAAAWLHGRAADALVDQGTGPIGLTASELIPSVRDILNLLIGQYARRGVSH